MLRTREVDQDLVRAEQLRITGDGTAICDAAALPEVAVEHEGIFARRLPREREQRHAGFERGAATRDIVEVDDAGDLAVGPQQVAEVIITVHPLHGTRCG